MFNTINTKKDQLTNGYFYTGAGKEIILIVGSCRSVPYINYLHNWNELNGDRFMICFIDPFNFNYNLKDDRIDMHEKINSLKTDENLLALLRSTNIVIHEWYSNYSMFNFDKSAETNIYQFGLKAEIDICIPSFNDLFILYGDIVAFDLEIRKKALQDHKVTGKLSQETEQQMFDISLRNILKFYGVCEKSDIPEMKQYFADNFAKKRLFWNSNHVSKHFTLAIFEFMNKKFLHLPVTDEFVNSIQHDLFANNFTYLTQYDIERFRYHWGEEIKPLL